MIDNIVTYQKTNVSVLHLHATGTHKRKREQLVRQIEKMD